MTEAQLKALQETLADVGLDPVIRSNLECEVTLTTELAELQKQHAELEAQATVLDGQTRAISTRIDAIEVTRRELHNARHTHFMKAHDRQYPPTVSPKRKAKS